MRKGAPWLLLLLVVLATLNCRQPGHDASELVLSGTIESRPIHIGSRIGGRIQEVLASEGALVKKGQVLLRLEIYDLDAQRSRSMAAVQRARAELDKLEKGYRSEEIEQAAAESAAARAELELIRKGPRPEEIEQARAEEESALADWENARVAHQRQLSLVERGVVAQQQLDDARTYLRQSEARLKAVRQRVAILLEGSRPEEIESAEKRYLQTQARLKLLQAGPRDEEIQAARRTREEAVAMLQAIEVQLREQEVVAPADAYVEVLDVRPGDLIAPNATVATLLEPDQIYVQVYVPETRLGETRLGTKVFVTVDSFPEQEFPGTISFVARQGEFTPRNIQTRDEREHQVFAARVAVLEDHQRLLRPGMAADVRVPRSTATNGENR